MSKIKLLRINKLKGDKRKVKKKKRKRKKEREEKKRNQARLIGTIKKLKGLLQDKKLVNNKKKNIKSIPTIPALASLEIYPFTDLREIHNLDLQRNGQRFQNLKKILLIKKCL